MASTSTSSENKVEGWTKDDMFDLLEALKEVGLFDIKGLKECLPNKTEDEIKKVLDFYIRDVSSSIQPPVNKKERKMKMPTEPLIGWANFLIESHDFEELETETAAALRLIAEFEDKPTAACTGGYDFKKAYHMLADALEGKPLADDPKIFAIFDKAIVEIAHKSKNFHKNNLNFLQALCDSRADANTFFKPTEDSQQLSLRALSLKKNYNPLNISDDNLIDKRNPVKE